MSGSFRIAASIPKTLKTHDHLILKMTGGKTAIYHDPRRFGFLLPCPTAELKLHPLLAKMGADPLDQKIFTAKYLHLVFAARKAPIKQALMDQHLIAGIGNIYASEALFLSHIHPERAAHTLSKNECEKLKIAVIQVLSAALASGGSTLRDFVRGENETGYFQHQFAVYDRADQPCTQCKHPIQKLVQSGRATYFCAKCQPQKPMKK
jgi:formamidopyrimidine-DNA glycosylase